MAFTHFPNGVSSFGMPVMSLPWVPGNVFFVKPGSGSDGNDGLTPEQAFATVRHALDSCTANQNDTVFLIAESDTEADTTDYLSSNLDWNKDLTHLIGLNNGPSVSHRSRIAWVPTYAPTSLANLFTLSANSCYIANLQMYAGVDDAQAIGCLKITGNRNVIDNCHIAGIGHATGDVAGAYSLNLNNASENIFRNCTIGLTTIARGTAANHEILSDGGTSCARNEFYNCRIVGWCESAGNYVFLKAVANYSVHDWMLFYDCIFFNPAAGKAGGAVMTQAFNVVGSVNGFVLLQQSTIYGAGNVNVSDSGLVQVGAGTLVYTGTDVTDLGLALTPTNL